MDDSKQRRVSDLKLTVRDGEALRAVTPEDLEGYIEGNGYAKTEEQRRDGELVGYYVEARRPVGLGRDKWIFVPLRGDYADYVSRVSEFVRDMAESERRSELAVLLELLGVDDELPLLPVGV